MRRFTQLRSADAGFTLIEVLVAATVLVIGVCGTLGLLIGANNSTTASTTAEGGTNLAREVSERVRQVPITQLTPAALTTALQAMSGLTNTNEGAPGAWTVKRRNTVYTLDVQVCAVDDPKDGSADVTKHTTPPFCTDGFTNGTGDGTPQDYQRVTVDVSWQAKNGTAVRHAKQIQMISGRGADGPGISAMVVTSPTTGIGTPAAPIISSTSVTNVTFKITTDPRASSVNLLLNGSTNPYDTAHGPAANGTDWTFTLPVNTMEDGSYEVAAQAVDARGTAGPLFFIPLLLNRYAPNPPADVVGSMNTVYFNGNSTPVVEVRWTASKEANVTGYRVYRPDGTQVCDVALDTTTCYDDTNQQDGNYSVTAVYLDANAHVNETAKAPTQTPVVAFPFRTWWLDRGHNNDTPAGSSCATPPSGLKTYDMLESVPPAGGDQKQNAGANNNDHRFFAPTLTAPIHVAPRPETVTLYFKNNIGSGISCPVDATLHAGTWTAGAWAAGTWAVGPVQQQITPAGSALTPYTYSLPSTGAAKLPIGARPVLDLHYDPLKACDPIELHFDAANVPSAVSIPTSDYPAPNPPTNVHGQANANGEGYDILWNAPTSGITPAFYRIYRDGFNYGDRYEDTDDDLSQVCPTPTTCSYTDPRPTGSNTYYVTAVSASLQESEPVPLPPAPAPPPL